RAREAAYFAGWTLYDAGQLRAASDRMRAFVSRWPRDARATEAFWYAGWASFLDGRFEDAIATWSEMNAAHPRSDLVPFAHYWTGRALQELKRTDEALRSYESTVRASPSAFTRSWRGSASLRSGQRSTCP
ncbi:MAG: tetratricopeptide repeat protein, partial [Myxococcales bacterium]|nr:tetratricopeptide repeat protein [Myxococcales bacterium]